MGLKNRGAYMLELRGLSKYYGDFQAVKSIDITIHKGDIFGFLGPNGAGKSTTISMIATLLKADSGQLLIEGQDIQQNLEGFKKRIGIVPQDIALYPMLTGMDNLKFWGGAYGLKGQALKKRIQAVSEMIGITDRLSSKVESYSGGMKRRLNIGAALLHEPEMLIMDEPTVGIDPQSRNHILESVKQLNQEGMTILYTSHYMEEVEYLCNRIAIMDHGSIIALGSKEKIKSSVLEDTFFLIELDQYDDNRIEAFKKAGLAVTFDALDSCLRLKRQTGLEDFSSLSAQIEKEGLSNWVTSIRIEKPSLEAVFLQLTGRTLRD